MEVYESQRVSPAARSLLPADGIICHLRKVHGVLATADLWELFQTYTYLKNTKWTTYSKPRSGQHTLERAKKNIVIFFIEMKGLRT